MGKRRQHYSMMSTVTMPNIPWADSAWVRIWQWKAHTPGSSHLTSTSHRSPGATFIVFFWASACRCCFTSHAGHGGGGWRRSLSARSQTEARSRDTCQCQEVATKEILDFHERLSPCLNASCIFPQASVSRTGRLIKENT